MVVPDLYQRFNQLYELREDEMVVNEDGTIVNPHIEIAMEWFGLKKNELRPEHLVFIDTQIREAEKKAKFIKEFAAKGYGFTK